MVAPTGPRLTVSVYVHAAAKERPAWELLMTRTTDLDVVRHAY